MRCLRLVAFWILSGRVRSRFTGNESWTRGIPTTNAETSTVSGQACGDLWSSWYDLSSKFTAAHPAITTWTVETERYRIGQEVGNGFLYTECDGIPRFQFNSSPTITSSATFTITQKIRLPTWAKSHNDLDKSFSAAHPIPTCNIGIDYCDNFLTSYRSERLKSGSDDFNYQNSMEKLPSICPVDGNCSIDMDEAILIYWPPLLTSRNICAADGYGTAVTLSEDVVGQVTAVKDAITFRRLGIQKWYESEDSTSTPFVLNGPFTFTSPTVYIAHRPVTAHIGQPNQPNAQPFSMKAHEAGIFPLPPEEVYTTRPWLGNFNGSGLDFVQSVATGVFDFTRELETTRLPDLHSVNYAYLEDPVPARLYYEARTEDCWATQTHCGTIVDGTYSPRLVFKNKVWARFIPEAFECFRPAVIDPPVALQGAYPENLNEVLITALPPPSVSHHQAAPTARPVSHALGPWPARTAAPGNKDVSPNDYPWKPEPTGLPRHDRSSLDKDGFAFNPPHPLKIGTGVLSASYVSGSLAAAYIGSSSLQSGQRVLFDSTIVSLGQSGVFVDETLVLPATPSTGGRRFPGSGSEPKPTGHGSDDEAISGSSSRKKPGPSYFSNSSHSLRPPAFVLLLVRGVLAILAL